VSAQQQLRWTIELFTLRLRTQLSCVVVALAAAAAAVYLFVTWEPAQQLKFTHC